MPGFFTKIIPVILIFFLGMFVKKIRLLGKSDADLFLKLVFNLTLPALTFLSVSTVKLQIEFFYLPFIAAFMLMISYFVARLVSRAIPMDKKTMGVFLIGCMIMNTGFALPFFIAAFDLEGIAIYMFFDLGNVLFIFTFAYYIAMKYGSDDKDKKIDYTKFLRLPPVWGLLAGVIVNFAGIGVPEIASSFLENLGTPTIPLIMLSLGIYFSPRPQNVFKIATVLGIRIGVGLVFGLFIASLLDLSGVIRTIVIISCGAPVGYNTLIFATLENLDKEFAASIVSISIFLGVFYIPILLFIL